MKSYNIVLAGCGVISEKWLDHICRRDDCRIIALVDLNMERAQATREKYRLDCAVYSDVSAALGNERGNLFIDLTYVTNHCATVICALNAGYDVLGEKPMAFSVEQVNAMLKAVAETGKRYIVMQNRRYIPQVRDMRQLIGSGLLGAPVFICGDIFVPADMLSIRNTLKYPQLQDNNIHAFDQARFLVGGRPTSVYYQSFNPLGSKYVGDAACCASFEFDNGCVFGFRGYNGAEGCHTTWDHDWRVVCERGTAIWHGEGDVLCEYTDIPATYQYRRAVIQAPAVIPEQHDAALSDMFAKLKSASPAQTECWDNVYSIAMVLASVKSADEKRRVGIRVDNTYPYLSLE